MCIFFLNFGCSFKMLYLVIVKALTRLKNLSILLTSLLLEQKIFLRATLSYAINIIIWLVFKF